MNSPTAKTIADLVNVLSLLTQIREAYMQESSKPRSATSSVVYQTLGCLDTAIHDLAATLAYLNSTLYNEVAK